MCGIVGAFGGIGFDVTVNLTRLAHRGPDGQGVKTIDGHALAHSRLAIVDVAGGQQPMNADNAWLACNGEIYNHEQLRAQYSEFPYKTLSDSEDILALWVRHGAKLVDQLHGMFAFAIVDGDELFLARDPLGIKPLYYVEVGRSLAFASEIKALAGAPGVVREFPAGHTYSSSRGFERYYDLETRLAARPDGELETIRAIRQTLRRTVHSHLMADVTLGVFLSGGLDSSLISAIVCEEMSGVHSFAVGMDGSADLGYARQMARHLGTHHHEYVYTAAEMREILPKVIFYLESFDPALVRSAIANYFLARVAADHVKVVLSGEGADELFGGYAYLDRFDSQGDLDRELIAITNGLHNSNLQRLDRMTMAHSIEGRVPFLDTDFVEMALSIPIEHKLRTRERGEKWMLRKAFEGTLPENILWRKKQKFASGAGSDQIFKHIAEEELSDSMYAAEASRILHEDGYSVRSKEELLYYRVFRDVFPAEAVPLVGFSRSL